MPTRRMIDLMLATGALALLPAIVGPRWWPVWVSVTAFALGAMVLDWLLVPRKSAVHLELHSAEQLYVGERSEASCRITVQRRRVPLVGLLRVDLSDRLLAIADIPLRLSSAGETAVLPLCATSRGPARIEAVWLRCEGPLRLTQRYIEFPVARELLVVPNVALVRRNALQFMSGRQATAGMKVERYPGDGSVFDSAREYRHGDDPRCIDWKVTARHTRLAVREYKAERNQQIILAVDTGLLMGEPLEGLPRLDHAIHLAMLLTELGIRAGDRVGVAAFGQSLTRWVSPRGGVASIRPVSLVLGELEYSRDETNYTLSLTMLMQELRRRSLVVVLTEFIDPVTAELMVENVQHLAKRHVVIFVAFQDPKLHANVRAFPSSIIDVNRAVVADTLLVERRAVFKHLERAGVHCVSSTPDSAGIDVIQRYLKIKRRELI
ncbi:MAG: DUF58 domain-containing protein [Myxococcales bacterium]|nr:DUF58 domain-containing protein [Myxococcales bacterium]